MRAFEILASYRVYGGLAYEGEGVTQLQHAWQCGCAAARDGATPALQLAAWLHDLGHLLSGLPGTPTLDGIDDRHEALGAAALRPIFGEQVSAPVALHVRAKQYLAAAFPGYAASLSPDSQRSLVLQGGPLDVAACLRFSCEIHAIDAARLRVWDDHAKVASLRPVSSEAALAELARLMDLVSEQEG